MEKEKRMSTRERRLLIPFNKEQRRKLWELVKKFRGKRRGQPKTLVDRHLRSSNTNK